ncbi:hypothetical protein CspeluHIS016_0114690 [Cutaneotrichosporon spelunceum]|uniref:Uncharacterized protein n=1 Tax=Cutaneotrichosporon spelunceum TaxID=1672016 RepID=A0AAD3TQ14_9TREE|nr:hypothetical protein CspeluHIS016_0114690 [Cutaneotrichosporon spelunceum]
MPTTRSQSRREEAVKGTEVDTEVKGEDVEVKEDSETATTKPEPDTGTARKQDSPSNPLFTIGHSTHPLSDFLSLLTSNGITTVVDVRKLPGSNKFPWFNADPLRASLAEIGIALARIEPLNGRRPVSRTVPLDVNAWWTNRSFHNYADHALGPEFRHGLDELLRLDEGGRVAVMCAEAVWWRCHRRIIADHVIAAGREVVHIIDAHPAKPATISLGAVVREDGSVVYPAARKRRK